MPILMFGIKTETYRNLVRLAHVKSIATEKRVTLRGLIREMLRKYLADHEELLQLHRAERHQRWEDQERGDDAAGATAVGTTA